MPMPAMLPILDAMQSTHVGPPPVSMTATWLVIAAAVLLLVARPLLQLLKRQRQQPETEPAAVERDAAAD